MMQTMYLMALSHSVAHGRKMLAFSLRKDLVIKFIKMYSTYCQRLQNN